MAATSSSSSSRTSRLVARALWLVPALLLVLTVSLADAAFDIKRTLEEGQPATADVIGGEFSGRTDVTYDYVDLRVTLPDGRTIEAMQLSLPHSLAPLVEAQEQLAVRVLPGADREVVIERAGEDLVGRPQWRVALINAVMALVGFLMATAGVWGWNRYLARSGDPALRVERARPDAAGQAVEG